MVTFSHLSALVTITPTASKQLCNSFFAATTSVNLLTTMFAIMAAAPKQLRPLFRPSVKIKFQESNPKNAGSQAFRRFQGYRVATTIKEAHDLGAKPCDLRHDWTLGYMKVEACWLQLHSLLGIYAALLAETDFCI